MIPRNITSSGTQWPFSVHQTTTRCARLFNNNTLYLRSFIVSYTVVRIVITLWLKESRLTTCLGNISSNLTMLPILENGSWTYLRIKEKKDKTRTETASCVRGLAAGAQGCILQGTTGPLMGHSWRLFPKWLLKTHNPIVAWIARSCPIQISCCSSLKLKCNVYSGC